MTPPQHGYARAESVKELLRSVVAILPHLIEDFGSALVVWATLLLDESDEGLLHTQPVILPALHTYLNLDRSECWQHVCTGHSDLSTLEAHLGAPLAKCRGDLLAMPNTTTGTALVAGQPSEII